MLELRHSFIKSALDSSSPPTYMRLDAMKSQRHSQRAPYQVCQQMILGESWSNSLLKISGNASSCAISLLTGF